MTSKFTPSSHSSFDGRRDHRLTLGASLSKMCTVRLVGFLPRLSGSDMAPHVIAMFMGN